VQAFNEAAPEALYRFNNRRSRFRKRQSPKEGSSMKSKLIFALAASMLTLALAASPQRASAAVNSYLMIDGVSGESDGGSNSGSHSSSGSSIWGYIVSLFS
jgi:hypothetical protein